MSQRDRWFPLSTATVRMLGLEQLARSLSSDQRRSRPLQRVTATLVRLVTLGLRDSGRR
jgi:hypothetical protein